MPNFSRTKVDAVRRFNRAYTRTLGVLDEAFLDTPFSLTEARVLYELSEGEKTAKEIALTLALDAGYLSRILDRFEKAKLIVRNASAEDRRSALVSLTRLGYSAYAPLELRSRDRVGAMIGALPASAQTQLLDAMRIVGALTAADEDAAKVTLRTHRPGDMGWITLRHAALYDEEYGYGPQFEALVADICAQFLKNYDAKSERCWIAELNGVPAGSVCLVRADKKTAKLRLMFLEPWARGKGAAQKLVDACIAFARACRYEKIVLWTQSELLAARKLYANVGFRLTGTKPHADFGKKLTGETWELKL
ncbi:MAG: bifunctional helix-turn-helix transcriptional regulator/GNAT family N-acetyltransferase [Xanthobacteraceae bacterium]|nr:bifunctional helix-turn-helix transcriptional regulator/GNAT family N-acetyltransferase [Xanthobacteraceae bacterium]QYK45527.1 MAG: bifunctional helix-turn-helix transcriptional regulator/GNAT family N-acetyltransferase [Xanthobacteraceae bacterium]